MMAMISFTAAATGSVVALDDSQSILQVYGNESDANEKSRPRFGAGSMNTLDLASTWKTQTRASEADAHPGHWDLLAQARAKKSSTWLRDRSFAVPGAPPPIRKPNADRRRGCGR